MLSKEKILHLQSLDDEVVNEFLELLKSDTVDIYLGVKSFVQVTNKEIQDMVDDNEGYKVDDKKFDRHLNYSKAAPDLKITLENLLKEITGDTKLSKQLEGKKNGSKTLHI